MLLPRARGWLHHECLHQVPASSRFRRRALSAATIPSASPEHTRNWPGRVCGNSSWRSLRRADHFNEPVVRAGVWQIPGAQRYPAESRLPCPVCLAESRTALNRASEASNGTVGSLTLCPRPWLCVIDRVVFGAAAAEPRGRCLRHTHTAACNPGTSMSCPKILGEANVLIDGARLPQTEPAGSSKVCG